MTSPRYGRLSLPVNTRAFPYGLPPFLPKPPPPPPLRRTITAADFPYVKGLGAPLRTDGKFQTPVPYGRHEADLAITATYDWKHGARPGVAGPPWPQSYNGVSGYDHMNVWGEVIPILGGMPAAHRDVRVQFTVPKVHHYNPGTDTWALKKAASEFTNLDGGYWAGDGVYKKTIDWPNTGPNAYWRDESVGWSADLKPTTNADGSVIVTQCIVHFFFPSAFGTRLLIAADDHVSILCWMRLISDNPNVDIGRARFVGRFAGDAFPEEWTSVGPNGVNPPLGMSRHVALSSSWVPVGYISGGTEAAILSIVDNHPLLGEEAPPD